MAMIWCGYNKWSDWYGRNKGSFGGNSKFGIIFDLPGWWTVVQPRMEKMVLQF